MGMGNSFWAMNLNRTPEVNKEKEAEHLRILEKHRQLEEKVCLILEDYKDDVITRILQLLKIKWLDDHSDISPNVEFVIRNYDDIEKIIIYFDTELKKQQKIGKSKLDRKAQSKFAIHLWQKFCLLSLELSQVIRSLNHLIDLYAPKENKKLFSGLIIAPPNPSGKPPVKLVQESNEGIILSDCLKKLSKRFEMIYNTRPLYDDEDINAQPINLFSMKRIKDYLATLPDNTTKLNYLKKIKHSYLTDDERAFIYKDGKKVFQAPSVLRNRNGARIREDFYVVLEREIEFYREISETTTARRTTTGAQNLEIADNKNEDEADNSKKKKGKNITPRNSEEVFLALEIFIRSATGTQKQKAKFMSFLSGYDAEMLRQSYSEQQRWERKKNHLKKILELFNQIGWTPKNSSFAKRVEEEIKELQDDK